jgi:Zn ribbon nucleic-acid-binding protein
MLFSLIILWLFFGATWKIQRNLVVHYWCRKCLQAGGSVCPHCGEKIVIEKGYYVNHLLFVTFYIGMIGRCVKCGYRRVIGSSKETLKTLGLEEKQWKKLAKETF